MATLIGKFIALDGIDGCGKGTQTKLLSDFLTKKDIMLLIKNIRNMASPLEI